MPALTGSNDDLQHRNPQPVEDWAALAGRWDINAERAKYTGPDREQGRPPLGIALAGPRFRDGTVRTVATLSRNERTTAGIIFGYQSLNAPYFVAQLGAFGRAYAVSEYRPGFGWTGHADAGLLSNIPPDVPQRLSVTVAGQRVALDVNNVNVLEILLRRPLAGTGFGLFAWDDAEIEFKDTELLTEPPTAFVIMPFAEPFDTLYREVILPVAESLAYRVVRIDEVPGPGIILDDIQRQIEGAHVIVAEISTHNPNVFYELGFAHALRKPAVLLVRREEGASMPFDVRSYRAIFYDDSIGGKRNVERHLRQHLDAVVRDSMP